MFIYWWTIFSCEGKTQSNWVLPEPKMCNLLRISKPYLLHTYENTNYASTREHMLVRTKTKATNRHNTLCKIVAFKFVKLAKKSHKSLKTYQKSALLAEMVLWIIVWTCKILSVLERFVTSTLHWLNTFLSQKRYMSLYPRFSIKTSTNNVSSTLKHLLKTRESTDICKR